MDEDTIKIIKKRFDSLPKSIQDLIMSSDYENILVEIGKQSNLNVEQMGILERETTMVMMGLTPTQSFESELTRELNVDRIKGGFLVREINTKIFLKIRDLLKLMNTPAGEEPSIEEEDAPKPSPYMQAPVKPASPAPTIPIPPTPATLSIPKNDKEILTKAGIEIVPQNLELRTTPELRPTTDDVGVAKTPTFMSTPIPPKKEEPIVRSTPTPTTSQETPPILAQKISDSVQTKVVKTEYSLNNISKANPVGAGVVKPKIPNVDPYREIPE